MDDQPVVTLHIRTVKACVFQAGLWAALVYYTRSNGLWPTVWSVHNIICSASLWISYEQVLTHLVDACASALAQLTGDKAVAEIYDEHDRAIAARTEASIPPDVAPRRTLRLVFV